MTTTSFQQHKTLSASPLLTSFAFLELTAGFFSLERSEQHTGNTLEQNEKRFLVEARISNLKQIIEIKLHSTALIFISEILKKTKEIEIIPFRSFAKEAEFSLT